MEVVFVQATEVIKNKEEVLVDYGWHNEPGEALVACECGKFKFNGIIGKYCVLNCNNLISLQLQMGLT